MEKEGSAGRAYDRAAQEYFARGFEKYLAEGRRRRRSCCRYSGASRGGCARFTGV